MFSQNFLKVLTCAAALSAAGVGAVQAEGDKSPWLIRLRAVDVAPDESSTVSINGSATVDSSVVPELDISYFWTDNIASELILATTKHNVGAVNTDLGDADLGHVWLLPPTLLMQYHFAPDAKIRPYVGAGLNYTFFYSADSGPVVDEISYDDGFGYALQAGVDIGLDDHWAINLDVKKLFLNTDVNIAAGTASADVDLDPWLFGVGLAYRF